MSYQGAGLHDLYLAPGGAAFPADGTGAFGLGYKDSLEAEQGPFNEIKLKSNLVLPSLENFKYTCKSLQFSQALIAFLLTCYKANDVSVKAITSGLAKATNFTAAGGLFSHDNANSMGIEFEIKLSPKERSITVICERAYKPDTAAAIRTAAKTDTLSGTLSVPALDAPNMIIGYVSPVFGSDIVIADDRLADWSISLKTRANKNSFNKQTGRLIDVEIMGVMDGPDPDELNTFMAAAIVPDLTINIGVDTPFDIILKSGGLSRVGSVKINEELRQATVNITGSYHADLVDTTTGGDITFQAKL